MSQEQFDKIMGLIGTGKKEGAKLETGGERHGEDILPFMYRWRLVQSTYWAESSMA